MIESQQVPLQSASDSPYLRRANFENPIPISGYCLANILRVILIRAMKRKNTFIYTFCILDTAQSV